MLQRYERKIPKPFHQLEPKNPASVLYQAKLLKAKNSSHAPQHKFPNEEEIRFILYSSCRPLVVITTTAATVIITATATAMVPPQTMKKRLNGYKPTHPLIWLLAIICTIIAVGVVIAGIVVFVGYLAIHPRVPVISVTNAHLDLLLNDYAGLLQTQLTIVVKAENGNAKAHATFSDVSFNLSYQGQRIAVLVAKPFEVPKNSSRYLNYVAQSGSIPLTPDQMEEVDSAWKKNLIGFDLKGGARTQWRVGPLGSVKFWCHLNCMLKFHPMNGSYIPSRCSSNSK